LRFGFEIFWRKNIGAKGACKMLMKLTPVVHCTNLESFFEAAGSEMEIVLSLKPKHHKF